MFAILSTTLYKNIYMQLRDVLARHKIVCSLYIIDNASHRTELDSLAPDTMYLGDYTTLSVIKPDHYIVYQIEQYSAHFTPEYIKCLSCAKYILEYSRHNTHLYKTTKINPNKIIYTPFMFSPLDVPKKSIYTPPEYDLAFYGTRTERRVKILTHLQKYFRVLIIPQFKIFCQQSTNQLHKCTALINIHAFSAPAILEVPRIHESILHNMQIISERDAIPTSETRVYNKYVHFINNARVDLLNMPKIVQTIQCILNDINNSHLSRHDTTALTEHANVIFRNSIQTIIPMIHSKKPNTEPPNANTKSQNTLLVDPIAPIASIAPIACQTNPTAPISPRLIRKYNIRTNCKTVA
jgi:hypothetical protein